ncbi:hypothetical protein PoB_001326300 [Plakobranchus ocellatus]|uniref:Uncharacterized protein n=1 Tax=Plakobranchus ocellatus TaxID=259542 RepID=A0AAV3YWH9_9GAST|nr:hypothetical protein PoB_001326300 [Plakobranchus ocellatus]
MGRSSGLPGRAVGCHVRGSRFESQSRLRECFIAPLYPPSTNRSLGLLRPGESIGGEESNRKLLQNAVCREQSGPYSWFSKLGPCMGSTSIFMKGSQNIIRND